MAPPPDYDDDTPGYTEDTPDPQETIAQLRREVQRLSAGSFTHSTRPVERWVGSVAFLHGAVVQIEGVEMGDPEAICESDQTPSLTMRVLPAVAPTPGETSLFRAVWDLADRLQARGQAKGSKVELALGVVLALHEQLQRLDSPADPHEVADIDTGATGEELQAALYRHFSETTPELDPPLILTRGQWRDVRNAVSAAKARTYTVHGPTATIARLNEIDAVVSEYLNTTAKPGAYEYNGHPALDEDWNDQGFITGGRSDATSD